VLLAAVGPVSLLCCLPRLLKVDSVLGLRLFLHRVPVLATLSGDALDTLTRCLQLERLPAGATVIREGDLGDDMYFIKSGSVEILQCVSRAEERVVRTLSPGDYVGEIALLRETPRTATVRTIEAVELYRLSRVDFQNLKRGSMELHDALERGMERYIGAPAGILLRR
jgi:CRP-like cAMP-binding protein